MALWCDFADTLVPRVSHNDVVIPIYCDPHGLVELSNGPLSALMAVLTSSRQGSGQRTLAATTARFVAPLYTTIITREAACDSLRQQ
jgi:hypothetical protein